MTTLHVITKRPTVGAYVGPDYAPAYRLLELGEPAPAAPPCEWCAARPAALTIDEEPFCADCLAELVKRGRRA